ncbi:Os10g0577000 [Oryza sativa Japonica Group]|uniref:Os10g0577000 protein n=1 Tax=Oryza sativa subsp. japonica TaxID=39947 RepID=A0A0P0XXP7_ORYSJ|nr:hypothetical protein EE612_052974 [Oryza sativa]BAT12209.1 Os10g0577000 [Oryza sativa Japonica Group]
MWVEILCGLLAYKIIRRVFFADSDDPAHLADLDSAHSDLCFALASRFRLPPPPLILPRCPKSPISLPPGSRSSTPPAASSASASPTPTPASASMSTSSSLPTGRSW